MRDIASIIGLKVISSKEGREVGTVSQAIVSLSSGELEGLIVGKGPSEKGIEAADIEVIGSDAVMVSTHRVARHLSELPGLMEKRRDPAAGPREVLTAAGRRLGVLSTIYIDPATKRVSRYEVSGGAWRDITEGVLSLQPCAGTVDGRDSVVVPAAALSAPPGEGGLKQQLAKFGELARSQAQQAAESLSETGDSVRRGLGDALGAAKNLTQSGQERKASAPPASPEAPPPSPEAPPPAPQTPEAAPQPEPAPEPCCRPEPAGDQPSMEAEPQEPDAPPVRHEDNGWEASQAAPSTGEQATQPEGDEQHNG